MKEPIPTTEPTPQSPAPDWAIALLAAGGIDAELIWEGSESDCPWNGHERDEGIPSAA